MNIHKFSKVSKTFAWRFKRDVQQLFPFKFHKQG